nr:hypothetical protein [Actinoplanes rishiriensis]
MVDGDVPLQCGQIAGAFVLAQRGTQHIGLFAIGRPLSEQVDDTGDLPRAQNLADQRFDEPADRHERVRCVVDRCLRACPRAQHRDDVLDVETGEQGIDQIPGGPGVEAAHLLQRGGQPRPDRQVEALESAGWPRRLAARRVRRVRERVEQTVDVRSE